MTRVSLQPIHRVAHSRPPAKLNLFLELLGKREDGYHEIETVMVAIDLCDELTVRATEDPGISVRTDWLPSAAVIAARLGVTDDEGQRESLLRVPDGESNLVHRALRRFRERFGVGGGFAVELLKRIPAAAGLGGASSDAAAAILSAAKLYGVPAGDAELWRIASEIGSDVPFFLGSAGEPIGAAVASGRGERIEAIPMPMRLHGVVVYPSVGLSTAAVYGESGVPPRPLRADGLVDALGGGSVAEVAAAVHNRLSGPAQKIASRVREILTELSRSGLMGSQVTGSGSACFALADSDGQAVEAAAELRRRLEPGALVIATRSTTVPAVVEIG